MANETGQSQISTAYATDIISREIAESLTASTGVVNFIWREQAVGTKVIKFQMSAALTASTFTDTTGLSLSEWDPTQASVTVAAHGVASRITDFAGGLRPSTVVDVGYEQGKAINVEVDTDITALFGSLTTNSSVNRTNATLRCQDVLVAVGELNAANVSKSDRVLVVSATQMRDLQTDAQTTNAYAFQQNIKDGTFGPLWGVPVFESTTCATANSAVDNVGALIQRKCIGIGSLMGINVEISRALAASAATDIATTYYYGVALIDAHKGVKLISKAS